MQSDGAGQQQQMNQLFSKIFAPFLLLLLTTAANASLYSEKIKNISLEKISSVFPHHDSDVICLSTPENPFLIGMVHQVPIHSAVEKVIAVFEDFESYPRIFKDLKQVKILEKNGPKDFIVEYENIIPIPFVPNSVYQMQYHGKTEDKPQFQIIYRFELKKGNELKSLDGVVVIKKLSPLYQEVDFMDADWGLAKTFAGKTIWQDTVTGSFESDFGLKFKSETPSMESKEIIKQSRFSVERSKIQDCLDHKKEASILF